VVWSVNVKREWSERGERGKGEKRCKKRE
jgi:hypothetical protein